MVTAAPRTISTSDKYQHKNGKPVNFTNHKCNKKPEPVLKYIIEVIKILKKNLTNTVRFILNVRLVELQTSSDYKLDLTRYPFVFESDTSEGSPECFYGSRMQCK